MIALSYDQPLQKLCFWNDCKIGISVFLDDIFEIFPSTGIQTNYKNSGLAQGCIAILQINKKSAARGFFSKWLGLQDFDRSYFSRSYLGNTL